MKYTQVTTTEATQLVVNSVDQALKNNQVLLLLSGGSNIEFGVEVIKKLNNVDNLTISLVDERYGNLGHQDSNWTKLIEAGLPTTVKTIPVLGGESVEETTIQFRNSLTKVTSSNYVIAIFGIGEDCHTSGILPHSSAVTSSEIVDSYQGPDFLRITTTPQYFKHINEAFLVAYGENKLTPLKHLLQAAEVTDQPAQALKQIERLTVFSDQIERLK